MLIYYIFRHELAIRFRKVGIVMQEHIQRLTQHLLQINTELSEERARTWVELLWSDYEATSAKAGYDFRGADYTEQLIRQLITSYGDKLHLFIAKNPKYGELLNK